MERLLANLERQCDVYARLEGVLAGQQAALTARDTEAVEAANHREVGLLDALASVEAERQALLAEGGHTGMDGLLGTVGDPEVRHRLELLRDGLVARVQRATGLARTNRVLAADAAASCAHLLRLLGLEAPAAYGPPARAQRAAGPSLRLDVRA